MFAADRLARHRGAPQHLAANSANRFLELGHIGLALTAIWETSGSGVVVEIKHEGRRILAALGGCCDLIDLRWTSGYVVVHDGV